MKLINFSLALGKIMIFILWLFVEVGSMYSVWIIADHVNIPSKILVTFLINLLSIPALIIGVPYLITLINEYKEVLKPKAKRIPDEEEIFLNKHKNKLYY